MTMPVVEHTDEAPDRAKPTPVNITDETRERFLEEAREWSEEVEEISWGAMDEDGNRTAGKFGELVFREVFGGTIDDEYDYDISYLDMRVDVKTEQVTVVPKWHFNAKIPDSKMRQDCDLYYWIAVYGADADEPFSKAWLCGYRQPDEFFEEATLKKRGEPDGNGFVFSVDTWRVNYSELRRRDVPEEITI